ncbi:MAG TPA: RNA ligase [Candidatus Saccharimonadales bacterium]|nr:RNA ligase [Candidatus Saccharimonadales bacterium]
MRKLLLLRGLPGSGKSTFIRTQGLEGYTLSADALRMAHAGPIIEANGRARVPADNDASVWKQLFMLLEKRMHKGELIVVDATHSHPRSFSNYNAIAKKYRYQVLCVDFSDVPFELCMERNQQREAYKVVPPHEMQRLRENMERTVMPKWITVVQPGNVQAVLANAPKDVSEYKMVHHIGDIQGCFDPLQEYFDTYGIQDDELYIFTGDLLDRGTQNAAVMQWALDNYHRPNFVFVEGNHEAHLRNWSSGNVPRSREFNEATKPQLEGANIAPKKVHGFLYGVREFFHYTFNGYEVLVTHGGLSTMPDSLNYISASQMIKGAGLYEDGDLADETFARTAPAHVYQIHGHRNRNSSPTRVNDKCFNLEGKVEFGGELRTVTLTREGFEERPIKSHIDASQSIIEPVGDLPGATESVADLLQVLRANNSIYEKQQDGTNISSFNFKRDVFYNKSWDHLNVHARGLFINTKLGVVVARAYEKFFNVGERPETQPDVLEHTLTFPVQTWIKENGYLGLVGYDPETDQLVFASKSSITSDFANWLRIQFTELTNTPEKQAVIKHYLQSDVGKTLVFEVIDPQNDPHIVTYENPKLVLLDVVHNKAVFEAVDGAERERIASLLGCPAKQPGPVFKDHTEFMGWLQATKDFNYTFNGEHIEGFVIEDAKGFMVKVKLPWYAFWRQMRTQLEHIQRGKKAQLPALDINNELAKAFLLYLESKDPAELQTATLVGLRKEFEDLGHAALSD